MRDAGPPPIEFHEANTIEPGRRRARKGVTISDVARAAGVSVMTVSRVVNGAPRVSDGTRKAVRSAIRKLGYFPDAAARSLVLADTYRLALLHGGSRAIGLSKLLIGVLEETRRIGAQVVLQRLELGTTDAWRSVRQLVEEDVAGAILPPPLCDSAALVQALHAVGLPVVALAPGKPRADTLCVRIDEYGAADELTRYLLALGHRRLGFIRGHPSQSASEECWRGFTAALRDASIDTSQVHMEQGFGSYRSGLDAARRLLSMRPAPTAIFASDDAMAAAVIAEAHRRGLDVPRSLSVVGFGDSFIARNIWPELTTIHRPVMEMASEAVNMLVQAIRAGRSADQPGSQHKLFAHTLVVRDSTAPAPIPE